MTSVSEIAVPVMDRNNAVFDDRKVSGGYERTYASAGQFLDRGEQTALVDVSPMVRGEPVLDVGAGAGRLAGALQLLTNDYVAIDYAPNMVAAFRRSYPGLDISVGDARDLSRFESERFGLIVFSNNGIDTVRHAERVDVLREFARVLRSSGRIVFSTLNRNGVSYHEHPFQLRRKGVRGAESVRALVKTTARHVLRPTSWPRSVVNWWRARPLAEDFETWAVGPLAVHDFAPFVHFTTLVDLRATVAEAGLRIERIYAENGSIVDPEISECAADTFTVVVRH